MLRGSFQPELNKTMQRREPALRAQPGGLCPLGELQTQTRSTQEHLTGSA